MHNIIQSIGWEVEIIRDDSDKDPNSTIPIELQGCSAIKMLRENSRYVAEIRIEECERDALYLVEADALSLREEQDREYTEEDLLFFRRKEIHGIRTEMARYTDKVRELIDRRFFK